MKIRELQKQIADALNGVEELVQGGCTALAEDSLAIQHELDKVLSAGGVSLVVVPSLHAAHASGTWQFHFNRREHLRQI